MRLFQETAPIIPIRVPLQLGRAPDLPADDAEPRAIPDHTPDGSSWPARGTRNFLTRDLQLKAIYATHCSADPTDDFTIWVTPAGRRPLENRDRWYYLVATATGVPWSWEANGGAGRRTLHAGDSIWISSSSGNVNISFEVA